jgi:hypothetical protein
MVSNPILITPMLLLPAVVKGPAVDCYEGVLPRDGECKDLSDKGRPCGVPHTRFLVGYLPHTEEYYYVAYQCGDAVITPLGS